MGVVLTQISYVNNITKQTQHIIQTELLSLFILRHFLVTLNAVFQILFRFVRTNHTMVWENQHIHQHKHNSATFFLLLFSVYLATDLVFFLHRYVVVVLFFSLFAHSLCLFFNLLCKFVDETYCFLHGSL